MRSNYTRALRHDLADALRLAEHYRKTNPVLAEEHKERARELRQRAEAEEKRLDEEAAYATKEVT